MFKTQKRIFKTSDDGSYGGHSIDSIGIPRWKDVDKQLPKVFRNHNGILHYKFYLFYPINRILTFPTMFVSHFIIFQLVQLILWSRLMCSGSMKMTILTLSQCFGRNFWFRHANWMIERLNYDEVQVMKFKLWWSKG